VKTIEFTNVLGVDFFPPKPAIKAIPDWYKDTPEYVDGFGKKYDKSGNTSSTIKKCIPILDAMTSGYILYTQVDLQVTQEDGSPYFVWPSQGPISFHPILQAPLHPKKNDSAPYPKWNNPYAIKTPPGYSSLFLPPMHNPNKVFTILEGLVDTDKYSAPVNFPFILNNVKWEGIIEAGTPMAQVIPIKRDSWEHAIGLQKEREEQNMITLKLKSILFNSYKKQFWSRKEYK
jgi:hypothetical protein